MKGLTLFLDNSVGDQLSVQLDHLLGIAAYVLIRESRGSSLRSQIEEIRSEDQIDNPGWIRKWGLNPPRIDHPKTAMGAESSFSLTRQAQTNRYDRRIKVPFPSFRRLHGLGSCEVYVIPRKPLQL
jgi:hypothetical protein